MKLGKKVRNEMIQRKKGIGESKSQTEKKVKQNWHLIWKKIN